MKIACFSFTDEGKKIGNKLILLVNGNYTFTHFHNSEIEGGIKTIISYVWNDYDGLIFIGATGIAIRMINPFIDHKTKDPAVIVIDDLGRYVISLLSGHIGGANYLTHYISDKINGLPIITTASDSRGIESIDIFAKNNNYYMEDMSSITTLTSMMVNGKKIGIYSEDTKIIEYKNLIKISNLENIEENIDGLIIVSSSIIKNVNLPYTILRPKNINIGIGCRKGMEEDRIIHAIESCFKEAGFSTKSIKNIGTVEVKMYEAGIIKAAEYYNRPLRIFTLEEIHQVEERFEKSQFVKDTIGVYSVSEPVAHLLGGRLITRKSKHNGITISISKENLNG